MSGFAETLDRFRLAVAGPAEEVPLGRAALLVAQAEHPGLDVEDYERRLQEIATVVEERLRSAEGTDARLEAANRVLFQDLGFSGDDHQHGDLRDLFLNEVLERRSGAPVTLAIVYVEVCQRAGLDVRVVGLPGHVVARLALDDADDRYIDVFRGGSLLSAEECRSLVRELYGQRMEFRDHFLTGITPRQVLQRLLHNVKARALQQGDEDRASRAIDLLLTMHPWDLDELRDRGMLRERLGDYPAALIDLEQYVRFRAGARDIQTVSDAVRSLRRHTGADAL